MALLRIVTSPSTYTYLQLVGRDKWDRRESDDRTTAEWEDKTQHQGKVHIEMPTVLLKQDSQQNSMYIKQT